MSDKLNFAGQFVIDAIDWIQPNGLALDIREHFQQILVYEDIFAPFMTGNVIMKDTIDIPNLYLNSGTDLLRLKLRTPGFPVATAIDKYFHIYKIDERNSVSDRSLNYIIHFISKENIMDMGNKISRTFKGTAGEIASTLCTTYLQTDELLAVDKSSNVIQYTSNFWIPTKNLVYIAERAIGDGNLPSFLFYENRNGLNLTELTKFADPKWPLMQTWHANNYTADISPSGQVMRDLNKDFQTVSNVVLRVNFDYLKDATEGLIKTRIFTYDFVTRQFYDKTATITDDELPLLNEQRFYKQGVVDSSGSKIMHGMSHFNLYNGAGENSSAVNTMHKRNVIMRAFRQHTLEITVFGRCDYTVGTKVWFDGNKMKPIPKGSNPNSIIDNLLSGFFIVSAVRHLFTRDNQHECKIELIKDSIQFST